MSEELNDLSIAAAARLIERHELSTLELTDAYLERIAALDDTLHAYITPIPDIAREQARRAQTEIMRGGARGPMHGMPFALKDIYDTRGIRTTGHSRLHANRIPEADCVCAERLLAAGGVLLGKLATHEFATGGPAYDSPWPPARNPWRLDRFPGGSSSGAAAAVAAGLAPGALGSDTGGSIRLPAAFCGLAGLKPSYGRVPKRGVLPLSWTLDTCGPLARTVEDCAIILQVIAGHDPLDPSSSMRAVPDFRATLDDGVAGLRIGVVRHFYEGAEGADDETVAAMDAALAVLRAAGAEVVDVTLPSLEDYQACYRAIVLTEAFTLHAENLRNHPELFAAITRYRILPGALISGADYVAGLRFQRMLADTTVAAFDRVDALVTVTTLGPAPVQATMQADAGFSTPPLTNPFNIAQLPAISVCNGFSALGLPLAMQVVGRPFDEAMALRVARAYERETVWHQQRPQLTPGDGPMAPTSAEQIVNATIDPATTAAYTARLEQVGLHLDAASIAGVCEAMPHVEEMLARLPRARDYATNPSLIYGATHN